MVDIFYTIEFCENNFLYFCFKRQISWEISKKQQSICENCYVVGKTIISLHDTED